MIKIHKFILLILLLSCARQIAPSGGPEDKTPPQIISTMPQSGETNISLKPEIKLEFSEKIDRDTFKEAFFVSPDPGEYKINFKGKQVQIELADSLVKDRTYVFTIGTSLRDNHNVAMENSFSFAFATGDSIDRGSISGKIFDPRSQNVMIWAYSKDDTVAPDPRLNAGIYSTQTGKKGEFKISYMSKGDYRVFAVDDAGKTETYNRGEDRIGIPNRDITITPDHVEFSNLFMKLSREDTLSPSLQGVSMRNATTIEARFSEIVLPDSSDLLKIVHISKNGTEMPIDSIRQFSIDKKRFDLKVSGLIPDSTYKLAFSAIKDTTGNVLDSAFSVVEFDAVGQADTTRPRIQEIKPQDKSMHISRYPEIVITFNEWMNQFSDSASVLVDSSGEKVSGTGYWLDTYTYVFKPDSQLLKKANYAIFIDTLQFTDLLQNALFDTTLRTFQTIDPDTLTSISGDFTDQRARSTDSLKNTIFLRADNLDIESAAYSAKVDTTNQFHFDKILPGRYVISGFIDENNNGQYDVGSLEPFKFSEYIIEYPDTIKVRSKWPNDGEHIILKD